MSTLESPGFSRGEDVKDPSSAPPAELIRALEAEGFTRGTSFSCGVLLSTPAVSVLVPVGDAPDRELLAAARSFTAEVLAGRGEGAR